MNKDNKNTSTTVTKNINTIHKESQTRGDRIADSLTNLIGSWKFINTFVFILVLWIGTNTYEFIYRPFDKPPFILLNLILSCVAAIQAPVIMMSQNRQEMRDRIKSDNNFETDLKTELLVEEILRRLDSIEASQNNIHNQILNKIEEKKIP